VVVYRHQSNLELAGGSLAGKLSSSASSTASSAGSTSGGGALASGSEGFIGISFRPDHVPHPKTGIASSARGLHGMAQGSRGVLDPHYARIRDGSAHHFHSYAINLQAGVRCHLTARSANFVRRVQADHRTTAYQMVQRLSLPGQRPGSGSTAPVRCGEGD
jgi:hypothetical protein